ncbi:MAG: RluA family pseudouridine synthase [Bacteroidota bacterium]
MKNKPTIIFEDDHLVVLNKPAGTLTIPDRYAREIPNLLGWLNHRYGKVFTIHRLDRETSGIVCFAKTEAAHRHLSRQFEQRTVDKYYTVLVEGQVHSETGIIDKPIAPNPQKQGRMMISAKGKPSLTHYQLLEHFKHFSLLEANIKTGRTHQIRIHFEAIGYPLAIDAVYGRRDAFLLSMVKKKYKTSKDAEERPLMSRTSLHARRLAFDHPDNQERINLEAQLPKDFSAVLKQLRKWGK